MKAVMVMFDTLSRKFLPPYGAKNVHAPNFQRLAEHSAQFDNCYAGSMPCMPARRELHTGRLNFLHRSWGPLEPFDDSMPEILDEAGIHSHLVTDHKHYWDDHAGNYHTRYTTFDLVRGQQGDRWIGDVAALRDGRKPSSDPRDLGRQRRQRVALQDQVNRATMPTKADHFQTKVFDGGLSFIKANHTQDNWFLQIETFDPHEPFFTYPEFRNLYPEPAGETSSVPLYNPVAQDQQVIDDIRHDYAALVSMCDESLGRVLDIFDELALWDDTMLIVWTDHGFFLGEHGWWGKSVQPWYDEAIHTPLFVWDPSSGVRGQRRKSLVQSMDLAPTLLDHFGLEPAPDMQGLPLQNTVAADEPVRSGALFGSFGGHVSVTDGRYVYMRGIPGTQNAPLSEYTLVASRVGPRRYEDLAKAALTEPLPFSKGLPVLNIPMNETNPFIYGLNPSIYGTLLFDLHTDPHQENPLVDDQLEAAMAELLVTHMRQADAPREQFERLGLPAEGNVLTEHLLCKAHHGIAAATTFKADHMKPGLNTPIKELLADPSTAAAAQKHLHRCTASDPLSPMQHAVLNTGAVTPESLIALDEALTQVGDATLQRVP